MVRNKKILTIAISTTLGLATVGAITGVVLSQKPTSIVNNNHIQKLNNDNKPLVSTPIFSSSETKSTFSTTIKKVENVVNQENENPNGVEYVMTLDENANKEGTAYFIKDGEQFVNEIQFKPGDTITVGITMNAGYEEYTARELRVVGKNQSYKIPSKNVDNDKNKFTIKMPTYEETLIKETGESWIYGKDAGIIKLIPTFIKNSIGTDNNKVDWEHGSLHGAFNGYVYELTSDTRWTTATKAIYETFKNDDITNPIDVFIYLNGYTLTFDVNKIKLDVPSGWALHFYNNRSDSATDDNRFGELKVGEKLDYSELDVQGSVTLGESVKFKQYAGVNSIRFVSFSNNSIIADFIQNDPSA